MDLTELLKIVTAALEKHGIRYAVVGSVASSMYGESRLTNDIDIVAEINEEAGRAFAREFPSADFYVSEDAIRHAIRFHSQFNIIHPQSGMKVDVIVPEHSDSEQVL